LLEFLNLTSSAFTQAQRGDGRAILAKSEMIILIIIVLIFTYNRYYSTRQ
jgi:hypothetical protein